MDPRRDGDADTDEQLLLLLYWLLRRSSSLTLLVVCSAYGTWPTRSTSCKSPTSSWSLSRPSLSKFSIGCTASNFVSSSMKAPVTSLLLIDGVDIIVYWSSMASILVNDSSFLPRMASTWVWERDFRCWIVWGFFRGVGEPSRSLDRSHMLPIFVKNFNWITKFKTFE